MGSVVGTTFYDYYAEEYSQVKYYVKTAPYAVKGVLYTTQGKSKSRFLVPIEKSRSMQATADGGKVTLTWNEDERATGYQVRYATFIPTKGGTVVEGKSGMELTLEAGTWNFTYRPYVEVKGKRIYGPWGSRRTITVN